MRMILNKFGKPFNQARCGLPTLSPFSTLLTQVFRRFKGHIQRPKQETIHLGATLGATLGEHLEHTLFEHLGEYLFEPLGETQGNTCFIPMSNPLDPLKFSSGSLLVLF
jgi:hypothetical protein